MQCQICGKNNHDARNCYNRSNEKDFPPTRQAPSRSVPKQARLASPLAVVDPAAWYFDSGATLHGISDMANLSSKTYTGNDGLGVGNGIKIPISHTSSSILSTHTILIHLSILHVPQITKNLRIVTTLTRDNFYIRISSLCLLCEGFVGQETTSRNT